MTLNCFQSRDVKTEASQLNKILTKKIREGQVMSKQEYKLLLLGTGESGKTTFIKQLKIIHGSGYKEKERITFFEAIVSNILTTIETLVKIMQDSVDYARSEDCLSPSGLKLDFSLKPYWEDLNHLKSGGTIELIRDYTNSLMAAIDDSDFQQCFMFGNYYNMLDSADYFLDKENLERILSHDYIPSVDDIIRTRISTVGIVENTFLIKRVIFKIIDVGGQRSERRKWINCFDQVTAILFLISLSEFDQKLVEKANVSRTIESVNLFSAILGHNCFKDKSFMLFLNKTDVLEKKIKTKSLRDYFSDFTGKDNSNEDAKSYFLEKFLACNRESDRVVYAHFTCATDTTNIKFVFDGVRDTIIQQNLNEYSLI